MRKKYGFKKVGHAGTLDPLAQGVLIVLTDKDTKRQSEFMSLPKIYQAEVTLGATTPSFDLETEVSFNQNVLFPSKEKVLEVLNSLVGEISMPAPLYSAKKVAGKRLYKIARSKTPNEISLPEVTTRINSIELLSYEKSEFLGRGVFVINFLVGCSSGTYIRSLASLIGEKLGTGAFLSNLIRTQIGDFKVSESQKFDELNLL